MVRQLMMLTSALAVSVLLLAGCSSTPTPTPVPPPTKAPAAASPASSNSTGFNANDSSWQTRSSDGGSVTVEVKPTVLTVGEAFAFDIAMNTHSVELSDDMTKISVLRDDAGKEYKPTTWDGPAGGGHHREGTLKFPALTSKPKYVELVIKGLAKVPERVLRWDLP